MSPSRALTLARRNLASNRKGALLSALGVAVGVGCLVFFTSLGRGVSNVVRTRVLPVDAQALEVKPPALSLGFFGSAKLDDDAVKRLAALDGADGAFPKMEVRLPASTRYDGDFFGRPLRMGVEVVANGLDPRLVEGDVAPGRSFRDPGPGQPIPVLASSRLLELYNATFAPSRGLPKLDAAMLTGFRLAVSWGDSFITGASAKSESGLVELVGFSPQAMPLGLSMPLESARRINREMGKDADTYSSVVVRAKSADLVPALAKEIRGMGFDLDESRQKLAEQVGFGIFVVTAALALLSGLVALLAAVNIAHAFFAAVRERRREIGLLRALGASERDVTRVLLFEAALIGLFGGFVGLASGWLATVAVDLAAARWLPDFPYKPASFFSWSWSIVAGALLVALVASVGGALVPARTAAKADPARALAE